MTARPRLRFQQLALGALSGLIYWIAFPPAWAPPLAFVAFVPVVWAARNETPWRALKLGVIMGVVSHAFAYFWIAHMIHEFAQAPWPLAWLVWLIVCVGQGSSYGVGVALARWLQIRTGWKWVVTLPVGLAAMDFLYPLTFPSYVANTQADQVLLIQIADLFGVLGITALIGAVNGAVVDLMAARSAKQPTPWRGVGVAAGLLAATLIYGAVRVRQVDAQADAAPKLKIGLVQSNIGGMENLTEFGVNLRTYRRMTADLIAQHADLVLWPEGAYGSVIGPNTDVSHEVLGGLHVPLAFGAVRVATGKNGENLPYNSAFMSDANGRVLGWYDKTILLVFGEYIPLGDWFSIFYRWIPEASHWGRGTSTAPLVWDDWKFGMVICYEDIIPRFVQGIMAPHDGSRPDAILNITNDSWYGHYGEQWEHLALASFRAVEHHRELVRATNTGISIFISPTGKWGARTKQDQATTLIDSVPRMSGTTVYEVIGDVVGYAAILVLAAGYVIGRRRKT